VVDTVTRRKGTGEVAEAYLQYLYTPEAQEVIAKHHYRPSDPAVLAKYASKFQNVKLFTIEEKFGGWKDAQAKYFAEGAIFDQVMAGR
jgi:sulfate transport system substrate-binding protein